MKHLQSTTNIAPKGSIGTPTLEPDIITEIFMETPYIGTFTHTVDIDIIDIGQRIESICGNTIIDMVTSKRSVLEKREEGEDEF